MPKNRHFLWPVWWPSPSSGSMRLSHVDHDVRKNWICPRTAPTISAPSDICCWRSECLAAVVGGGACAERPGESSPRDCISGFTAFSVVIFLGRIRFRGDGKSLAAAEKRRGEPVPATHQLPGPGHPPSTCFLYRGAREVGKLQWGKMTVRSQYSLLAADLRYHHEHGTDGLHPFRACAATGISSV